MFLFLPDAGWPRIIDQHPSVALISDTIGGMVSRLAIVSSNFGLCVRDDCGERHLPVNPAASVIASFAAHGPVPILGPAVLHALSDNTVQLPTGDLMGNTACMSTEAAEQLRTLAEDVMYAKLGQDARISERGQDGGSGWADGVRSMLEHIGKVRIPDGYPDAKRMIERWGAAERARVGDPVADEFARAGLNVKPYNADDFTI